jgi:two-component system sensor histidine kinase/response regulator
MTTMSEALTKDEMVDYAAEIRKAALSLFTLLENLLEWARLQQKAFPMQLANHQLHALVSKNLSLFENAALAKQIEVAVDVSEEIAIHADEKMISSVIRNLISNAIKFTNRGGKINVYAFLIDDAVEIHVTDSGVGMTEKELNKLFRIDEKLSKPGTENESSTGLGLLLSQELVQKHGGAITVKSEPGKGSDFSFTLPVGVYEEEMVAEG